MLANEEHKEEMEYLYYFKVFFCAARKGRKIAKKRYGEIVNGVVLNTCT